MANPIDPGKAVAWLGKLPLEAQKRIYDLSEQVKLAYTGANLGSWVGYEPSTEIKYDLSAHQVADQFGLGNIERSFLGSLGDTKVQTTTKVTASVVSDKYDKAAPCANGLSSSFFNLSIAEVHDKLKGNKIDLNGDGKSDEGITDIDGDGKTEERACVVFGQPQIDLLSQTITVSTDIYLSPSSNPDNTFKLHTETIITPLIGGATDSAQPQPLPNPFDLLRDLTF